MQRAFGYEREGSPTQGQIKFIGGEIQRLADANGMEPSKCRPLSGGVQVTTRRHKKLAITILPKITLTQ